MQADNNDETNSNSEVDTNMEEGDEELQEALALSYLPSKIFDEHVTAYNATGTESGPLGRGLSIAASISNAPTISPSEVPGGVEMLQNLESMINSPQNLNSLDTKTVLSLLAKMREIDPDLVPAHLYQTIVAQHSWERFQNSGEIQELHQAIHFQQQRVDLAPSSDYLPRHEGKGKQLFPYRPRGFSPFFAHLQNNPTLSNFTDLFSALPRLTCISPPAAPQVLPFLPLRSRASATVKIRIFHSSSNAY
ncbi:hypothetical protein M422DRAFT_261597 [Sphaerobolus stellatus SS14]|uniref:Uncharacterized protein n=1 Tax=Sphaerobolus stellatus (strain SS14) TaxID=990650 RepID=A0A0C9UMH0_SPHS4|nr:hypothetical protein M422DRAFT_261597 [Sphaerobolus stellatus SS14]